MTVVAIPHFLAAEVARLDALITRAVLAMRMRRALTQEEFCGLRVSDAQIDAALTGQGRPPPGSVNEPRAPLPGTGPPSRWVDLVRRLDLSVADAIRAAARRPGGIQRRNHTPRRVPPPDSGTGPFIDIGPDIDMP